VLARRKLLSIGKPVYAFGLLRTCPAVDSGMNEQDGPRNDNDYSSGIQAADQQAGQGICMFSPC